MRILLLLLLLLAAAWPAAAQDNYPNRTIRGITTTSPGGISDIFLRALGDELSKRWGQSFIIENRPGGSQNLGTRACSEAAPDGSPSASSMPTRWSTTSSASGTCRSIRRMCCSRSPACTTSSRIWR
jgi:tripartite-type tricarboxylate transporter receptor subunit TctC